MLEACIIMITSINNHAVLLSVQHMSSYQSLSFRIGDQRILWTVCRHKPFRITTSDPDVNLDNKLINNQFVGC